MAQQVEKSFPCLIASVQSDVSSVLNCGVALVALGVRLVSWRVVVALGVRLLSWRVLVALHSTVEHVSRLCVGAWQRLQNKNAHLGRHALLLRSLGCKLHGRPTSHTTVLQQSTGSVSKHTFIALLKDVWTTQVPLP